MAKRHRGWCGTLNNPTTTDIEALQNLLDTQPKVENVCYLVAHNEIGESGTPHIQMYVEWENPKTLSASIKCLGSNRWHLEPRRGEPYQAMKYCLKEVAEGGEPRYEFGERPKEGSAATIWDALANFLLSSPDATDADICRRFPKGYTKYWRSFAAIIAEHRMRRLNEYRPLEVHYWHGPPRSGKTRGVMDLHGPQNVFRVTNYKNPFDNYGGQKVLLLEEFRSQLPLSVMLALLDHYITLLPARYADKVGLFDTVYIVSNWSLDMQYCNMSACDLEPFHARITTQVDFTDCTNAQGVLKGNTTPLVQTNESPNEGDDLPVIMQTEVSVQDLAQLV